MNTFWKYTTLGMIISATVSGCGSGPTDGDEAVEATTGALSNDPSLIRTGSDCGTQTIPGAEQVLIYSGFNFSGTCKVLLPGFYPLPANMNIPNDSLRSLKLGSAVRVRAFDDQIYGVPLQLLPSRQRPSSPSARLRCGSKTPRVRRPATTPDATR